MRLTFGKFKGMDTEQLKSSADGVSYLEWGATSLDNTKWRSEFRRVLGGMTVAEEVAVEVNDRHMDPQLAERFVGARRKDEEAQTARANDRKSRRDAIVQQYAARVGVPFARADQIVRRFEFADISELDHNRRQFSTVEKFEATRNAILEVQKI